MRPFARLASAMTSDCEWPSTTVLERPSRGRPPPTGLTARGPRGYDAPRAFRQIPWGLSLQASTPSRVRKPCQRNPTSAAPVIPAHMENGIVIGAAVLCIITLVLLLTLKR